MEYNTIEQALQDLRAESAFSSPTIPTGKTKAI